MERGTQHPSPQIFSLAWSPDGKKLATVSKDGRLRLYEPRHSPQPQQVRSQRQGRDGELGVRAGACTPSSLRAGRVTFTPCRRVQVLRGAAEHAWFGFAAATTSWCPASIGKERDAHQGRGPQGTPCPPSLSPPHSRSERRILLYRAQALPEGPLSVLGLDVAPSTLLPFYDEDTGVVFLTGKVRACRPKKFGGYLPIAPQQCGGTLHAPPCQLPSRPIPRVTPESSSTR